jgi:uncharacterized protein
MEIIRKISLKTALIVIGAVFAMVANAIPTRPVPQRLVNDQASIFTPDQKEDLERMLVAFDDSTSNQIAVVTVLDLEGYPASEYATRIGLEWGVGSEKFDNGVVLLVKPRVGNSYGEVFIAVGYGLEGAIPDAYAKRIVDTELIPHLSEGDYYGGVVAACEVLMKLASGEISELREDDGEDVAWVIASIFLVITIVIIVIALNSKGGSGNGGGTFTGGGNSRRTISTGPVIHGGFGGGRSGGSFGGGFGGFGGGSFGGGGAGGRF